MSSESTKIPTGFTKKNVGKWISEFIGTFFLLATIRLNSPVYILLIIVYALAWISGAHFNPSVSITLLITGNAGFGFDDTINVIMYFISQFLGGFAGAMAGCGLLATKEGCYGYPGSNHGDIGHSTIQLFFGEFLYTFLLCFVVANCVAQAGNQFYGMAIGFTVFTAANSEGPISGGSLNPAMYVGAVLSASIQGGDMTDAKNTFYVYFLAQILAAIVAGVLFKSFYGVDTSNEDKGFSKIENEQTEIQTDLQAN